MNRRCYEGLTGYLRQGCLGSLLMMCLLLAVGTAHAQAQRLAQQAVTVVESGAGTEAGEARALDAAGEDGQVLRQGAVRMDRNGIDRVFRQSLPALRAGISGRVAGSRGEAVRRQALLPPVRLQLFPDTVITFQPKRVTDWLPPSRGATPTEATGRVLQGVVTEGGEGTVVLSEFEGALSGAVRLANGEYYELEVYPEQAPVVRQLRMQRPPNGRDEVIIADRDPANRTKPPTSPQDLLEDARLRLSGDEHVVTVTLFYTPRVLQRYGGPAGLRAFAGRLEEESSEVFRNSEVPAVYRIVALRMVHLNDSSASMDWIDAFYWFDDYFGAPEATGTRLATLLVGPPLPPAIFGYTMGIAFQRVVDGGPERLSMVHQNFAAGPSLVFAHEAGHNLGCVHDAANGGADGGLYGDSRGYQQTALAPNFYTVMAYPCAGCRSIPYYSEPKALYEMVPSGKEGARCAATLAREIAETTSTAATLLEPRCAMDLFPGALYVRHVSMDFSVRVETGPDCEWQISGLRGGIVLEDLDNTPVRKGPGLLRLRTRTGPPVDHSSQRPIRPTTHVSVGSAVLSVYPTVTPWGYMEGAEGIRMRASATPDSPQEVCTLLSYAWARLDNWQATFELSVHAEGLAPWMTFRSTELSGQREVCIRADTSGQTAGVYGHVLYHELNFRPMLFPRPGFPATRGTSHTLPVEVKVTEEMKPVRYSPRSLSFRWTTGEAQPAEQVLELDGPPSLTLLPPTEPRAWLQTAMVPGQGGPLANHMGPGNSGRIRVSVRPQILAGGVHNAEVRVGCPDGACAPRSIPVRLQVTAVPVGTEPDTTGPRIASGGVVNAASFSPGLSAGSWMSIFGERLAASSRGWASGDFAGEVLPTRLDDVRVRVDGVPAAISFISPGQVNFQCPTVERTGWVPLEITNSAGSHTVNVWVEASNPGVFLLNAQSAIAALHADAVPAAALGALGPGVGVRPAQPGDVLALYGTGLGVTVPAVQPGRLFSGAAPLPESAYFKVYIGGMEAEILFAGLSGAGLNQINLRVPDLPPGDHPVRLVSSFRIGPPLGTLHVAAPGMATSALVAPGD
jgi:uncharacterized protein (TIGR03437 family)